MKRKFIFLLLFVVIALFNFTFLEGAQEKGNNSDQMTLAVVTADANADSESLICRCHDDGMCWAGSWLSFRIQCAEFSEGTGDCHQYDLNCY